MVHGSLFQSCFFLPFHSSLGRIAVPNSCQHCPELFCSPFFLHLGIRDLGVTFLGQFSFFATLNSTTVFHSDRGCVNVTENCITVNDNVTKTVSVTGTDIAMHRMSQSIYKFEFEF
jgi:hypothetical protein